MVSKQVQTVIDFLDMNTIVDIISKLNYIWLEYDYHYMVYTKTRQIELLCKILKCYF